MKRKSPFDPQSTVTFWINHASRLLMRHFEQRLRPLDFGMAYLPVLFALDEHGALQQKDLAAEARVEQPTMAALLARMERDGLIERTRHPHDKRAALISLSPKAKRSLPAAKEQLLNVVEASTDGIDAAERAVMISLLKRMVSNLD